jgi:hypothetical protein
VTDRALSESEIQTAIVIAIRRRCPGVFVAHVPNGGSRHKREAMNLKREGVVAGVPDLLIIGPTGRVGFLEVKRPGGTLSYGQVVFKRQCLEEWNLPWALVRSVEEALSTLESWGAEVKPSRTQEAA